MNTSLSFTERDIEKASAIAEDMVRIANEALQFANKSTDATVRRSKVRLAKLYIERLKIFCIKYSFVKLTALSDFELSVSEVEAETNFLYSDAIEEESRKSISNKTSIKLKVFKFAEIVGSKIVVEKNVKQQYASDILTNLESCNFIGPNWTINIHIGEKANARDIEIELVNFISNEEYSLSFEDPVLIETSNELCMIIFRNRFFMAERQILTKEDRDQARLRVKKLVYDEEGDFTAIRAAVSNIEAAIEFQRIGPKREPIPDDVKMLVWSRDGGSCVRCGSNQRLHFDHVIPVAKGGSSESINIQLLCQTCNLKKSDKIAF